MPIKVYITIDTEEDQWSYLNPKESTVENIREIPKLQELFDQYGAIPTYLINYPVAINKGVLKILQKIYKDGRCDIGAHCHPWNTPPFRENISNHNSMLCNLPYELVFDKIQILHKSIKDIWNFEPKYFRAGRWGFGENVARAIFELGYKIDTSIAPFTDWSVYEGPDFSNVTVLKYRFNPDNILKDNSNGSLLEISPTIGFLQNNFKIYSKIRNNILKSKLPYFRIIGLLDKLKIMNYRWLSPELFSGNDMAKLANCFLKNNCQFLNMSFHSTSLLPGLNPFIKSQYEVEKFYRNIDIFLKFAYGNGFIFAPLNEAIKD